MLHFSCILFLVQKVYFFFNYILKIKLIVNVIYMNNLQIRSFSQLLYISCASKKFIYETISLFNNASQNSEVLKPYFLYIHSQHKNTFFIANIIPENHTFWPMFSNILDDYLCSIYESKSKYIIIHFSYEKFIFIKTQCVIK